MTRLYTLAPEYARLAEALDDGEDVATDLALITDALEAKVANLCHVIADLDDDATAIRTEEKRLAARRQARENRAESLREYLREGMTAAGIAKIKTPTHTITLGEGPPRCVVDDEAQVPAEYHRIKVEIDKRAILDAFTKQGECVAGTHVERGSALRIK